MAQYIKSAVITGAGSGIGRALAHALADRGVKLCLTDINAGSLAEVGGEITAKGGEAHVFDLDVADRRAVYELAEKANALIGPVDSVFNNAGVSLTDTVAQMEYEDFEWLMNINFWGVVHGTKAFMPKMVERGFGHIINISSLFGLIGVPSQAAYCASKHAVKGFNESLSYELEGTGVQVHSVHPGGVDTEIIVNGLQKHNADGTIDIDRMQNRFKKMAVTSPEEAARIILAGVDKGSYRILVGPDARKADRFSRWMPNIWRKIFAGQMQGKGGAAF